MKALKIKNESFISDLKESDVAYITHDNIIKKHLYRDGLTLDQNNFYNLRSDDPVTRRNIRTNKSSFETISTIGVVLSRNLPNDTI